MAYTWKTCKIFEKEQQPLEPESQHSFDKLADVEITSVSGGSGQIVFGDSGGNLHCLNNRYQLVKHSAFELCVTNLYQLKQHNVLVSAGMDEEGNSPLIKVWDFEKDKLGSPICARTIRVNTGKEVPSISCLSAHENMNMIAVGTHQGTVTLIRGNLTKDRSSRQRVIDTGASPITGLGFKQVGQSIVLFVSTTEQILSYVLTAKDSLSVLDAPGCKFNCSVMSDHTQDFRFVVGRSEAVYFYTPKEKGQCLAFEGEKKLLRWFRGHLVVVSATSRQPLGSAFMHLSSEGQRESVTLSIYDIKNSFVAFTGTFHGGVVDVVGEWGCLYVVTRDHKLVRLEEYDMQSKLQALFKKNMYPVAISLAESQSYADGLMDIFTQYGDHLYQKGDYDGAMMQYKRTIGKLEPSYVIRKYLDTDRTHNLTDYLEALHKNAKATPDHTTLLLNCYTKLKDVTKLEAFITTSKEINFDVVTAIKVCRQAGYRQQGLVLARQFREHEWYLRIQLEDVQDYEDALRYIEGLSFSEIESNLIIYGKKLVAELPHETTLLVKKICTGLATDDAPQTTQKSNPEKFLHIFINCPNLFLEFLEEIVEDNPDSSSTIYNTLLELNLRHFSQDAGVGEEELRQREERILQILQNRTAQYDLDHALMLAQVHDFRAGILYLYEKAKLYQQILVYHVEKQNHAQVIDTCKRHGARDSSLWVKALTYFASRPECKSLLKEVLEHIERQKLLPLLVVVQILSESKSTSLQLVKDLISKHLQSEEERIQEDEKHIKKYVDDTAKMQQRIEELKVSATIFQITKCSLCNNKLFPPSVHFLCQHSYHQSCVEDEGEYLCPLCHEGNQKVLDIIRQQEQNLNVNEQFHKQLQATSDGFSVVAEYFGRGVMNTVHNMH